MGTLPSWIGDLQSLSSLSAYNTNLYGSLPESLYGLRKLNSLRLYKCQFSGTISPTIGGGTGDTNALMELKWLWIHDNQFTGVVPSSIGNLAKLEGLTLHGNEFEVVDGSLLGKESGGKEELKDNVIPKEVCYLRLKNLSHLWGDCEEGALEEEENVVVHRDNGGDVAGDLVSSGVDRNVHFKVKEGVRACSCCTRCFPKKKKKNNDNYAAIDAGDTSIN